MALDQQAQVGELPEVRRRTGRNLEAALPLRDDEPLRRQPVQDLAQGADADAVDGFQPIEW